MIIIKPINFILSCFQESLLEEDHLNVNLNSIPTQTFSSSLYNNRPTDEAILKILSSPPQHRTVESGSYKVIIII